MRIGKSNGSSLAIFGPSADGKVFMGRAQAGKNVSILLNGSSVATVTADAQGFWTYTFASAPLAIDKIKIRSTVDSAEVSGLVSDIVYALTYRGINFAGMEYGDPKVNDPDVAGGWNRPLDTMFPYYTSRGFNLVRIPYKIERCQPGGPGTALGSDSKSAAYMATLVDLGVKARAAGMKVMWDAHNYAKIRIASDGWANDYYVGTSQFPVSALADFHVKFANYAGLVLADDQIDLMNEPTTSLAYNGQQVVTDQITWINACISALRAAGKQNLIHAPGMSYSSASGWSYHGTDQMAAGIVDSANNFCIHLHQYTDQDQSGSQDNTFYGIWYSKLLRAAREGALKYGYKLFLGEFNSTFSTNSSQATVNAGRNALHECMQEVIAYPQVWLGVAGWRGGGRIGGNDITSFDPWSGGYTSPNSNLQPADGNEREKLTDVKRYMGAKVTHIIDSTIDLDLARNAFKGGSTAEILFVDRRARPGTEEDGTEIQFGLNVPRITRRGLKIDAAIVDDNLITTQNLTGAGWVLSNPNGNRMTISQYVDPADGQTYTRLQMTGDYNTSVRFPLTYAGTGTMSLEIKTLGTANQYVGLYSSTSGDKDINIDGTNANYPKNQWFRAFHTAGNNWGFHLLNRSVTTDILIRRLKFNLGTTATPWSVGNYDADDISIEGALLAGIATGDFTLLVQTRDLSASGVSLPIVSGVVGGNPISILTRESIGALSTALGGTLATAAQPLVQWSNNGGEYGSRRVAISVRRSGSPKVVIGATGVTSVSASQSAGTIDAALLGSLGSAYLGGLIERITFFPAFKDVAAIDALVA